MKDILLNRDGDLVINATGNIEITDSVAQAIIIRLRWFFNEWRFAPQYGVPYFEEVLVKNPSDLRVRQIIRDEILSVEEVESVSRLDISIRPDRKALIRFAAVVRGEQEELEVTIYA